MSTEVRSRMKRQPSVTARADRNWSGAPIRGFLPLILLLLGWQIFGNPRSPYFPPPSQWYAAVSSLIEDGALFPALGATTLSFVLGLTLATLIGGIVGLAIGSSRLLDKAFSPTMEFLRALPAASLVPVGALLLGYEMSMKLSIVVLTTVWPVLLSTRAGRKSMPQVLLDVPRTLRLRPWERLFKVMIPALMRSVLVGVRVAAPVVLIITLLVEIITRMDGLGGLLSDAQSNYRSAEVYGLLVVAGVLGYLVNWLVVLADGALSKGSGRSA